MKAGYKVWLDQKGNAFGDSPYELLRLVERRKSLHQAALQMNMSYSKAWQLIRTMEGKFGFPLLERKAGGKFGGGSKITLRGIALMNRLFFFVVFVFVFVLLKEALSSSERMLIFAGAASKPATEEMIKVFREKFGVTVDITFGGSGFVLSQMKLTRKGDLYFPGSSDFMEMAKKDNLVFPESERMVVYLIPAINVQKGNPKGIHFLRDLTKDGIRVAIANPEMVCVGTYAVEVIEKNFTLSEKEKFRKNLINYTESCEKTAMAISLKAVDAVIGWRVFQYWDPERIESIYLKPKEIPRIGYIPIAVSRFTHNLSMAQKIIDFLISPEGKIIFRKYHYLMDIQEARRFTKPDTPVGGEYLLPEDWRTIKK